MATSAQRSREGQEPSDQEDAWSEDQAQTADGEQQVPWRELAAGWQRILTSFGDLFESDEEEEMARQAFHRGGMSWRRFFTALNERRRDRTIFTGRR